MIPLPLVLFGGAVGAAWWRAKPKRQAAPDPTVSHVFRQALDARLAPDGYRKLADWMERWGYLEEARVLRARAGYGELPDNVRQMHHEVITRALASDNAPAVRQIADNLYKQGAIANAMRLRKHAAALEAAITVKPVEAAPPPPPPAPPPAPAAPPPTGPTQAETPSPGEAVHAAPAEAAE